MNYSSFRPPEIAEVTKIGKLWRICVNNYICYTDRKARVKELCQHFGTLPYNKMYANVVTTSFSPKAGREDDDNGNGGKAA